MSQSLIIGSAASCEIRVNGDPYVSAQHCQVTRRDDGSLWVADLGSTNGTWLELSFPSSVLLSSVASMRERVSRPMRWPSGWALWVSSRNGLELNRRGWVRAVSR